MVLEFTIYLQEEEVTIHARDGKKTYVLRELDGHGRNKWLNELAARAKKDENGKAVGVMSYDGIQESLLTKCLFDDRGNAVPAEVILSWPSKTVDALFTACQKMNALNEEGEEAAKKD